MTCTMAMTMSMALFFVIVISIVRASNILIVIALVTTIVLS